jgi:hypothetical protein
MRPTELWNPPAGLANASGAISSGLVGEIGVSPGRSMRPYGACGTNVDSGADSSGCSGAGASYCSGAGVKTAPSPQLSSYEGVPPYEGVSPYMGAVASSPYRGGMACSEYAGPGALGSFGMGDKSGLSPQVSSYGGMAASCEGGGTASESTGSDDPQAPLPISAMESLSVCAKPG